MNILMFACLPVSKPVILTENFIFIVIIIVLTHACKNTSDISIKLHDYRKFNKTNLNLISAYLHHLMIF